MLNCKVYACTEMNKSKEIEKSDNLECLEANIIEKTPNRQKITILKQLSIYLDRYLFKLTN